VVIRKPEPNSYTRILSIKPTQGNNPVTGATPRNGQTAAALLLSQKVPRAMEMDATNKEEMVVSGGKVLLHHTLHTTIRRRTINPLQALKDQVRIMETGKRVIKATKSTAAKDKVERIAETLAKEQATTP
jgi:hypothetical protein